MSEETKPIRRADWVSCRAQPDGPVGSVKRTDKTGMKWADVDWGQWRKRMKREHLVIRHTIPCAGGSVTDESRKAELETA